MQIQSNLKVNELIKEEMKKQGLSPVHLANKIQVAPSSVYILLGKSSIQVARLWTICEALKINFFRILSDQINISEPNNPRIKKLEDELSDIRKENETLKEVIALLGGNK